MAQAISNIEMSRTIDENPADLKEYGLTAPVATVEFKAGNTSGSLTLGEKTPTMGDMYAMKGGDKKVFLVPAFQETLVHQEAVRPPRQEDPEVRSRQGGVAVDGPRHRVAGAVEKRK